MEWILIIGALILLSRGSAPAAGGPLPAGYTYSPNAVIGGSLNLGGGLSTPILSSALNGMGRPLQLSFGSGGNTPVPQSDPVYGNPGAGQAQLGLDVPAGIALYDPQPQGGGIDVGAAGPGLAMDISYSQ